MPYDPHDQLENYVRERLIGRGGSSNVYLARCTRGRLRGRRVALKMIPLSALPTSSHLNNHLSSTVIHTGLHHPSVVSLLATFNTLNEYCQVLELCSTTLSSFMASRNPHSLTESEARGVFKAVVDALVYLARESILHRDIKADNILLTEDGRIKLGDFGLAVKLEPPLFEVSTFCGTPNYLSPEVVQRRPYGATSDVWALGCLMITILTGQPPFQGHTVEGTFRRVRIADYSLPDSLSYDAKDLIHGLLQIKPERRTPIHRILFHPFFNSSQIITPLNPTVGEARAQSTIPLRSRVSLSAVANKENITPSEGVPRRAASVRFMQDQIEPPFPGALRTPERAILVPSHPNQSSQDVSANTKPRNSSTLDKSFLFRPSIRKFQPTVSSTPSAAQYSASLNEVALPNPNRKTQLPPTSVTDLPTQKLRSKRLDRQPFLHKELPASTPQSMVADSQITQPPSYKFTSRLTPNLSEAIRQPSKSSIPLQGSSQTLSSVKLDRSDRRSQTTRTRTLSQVPSLTQASPSNFSSSPVAGSMAAEGSISPAEKYRFRVPPPLSVAGLPAGVHHIRHGSIEFLPRPHGLRLDLRASEKKAGRAGDEILQISANGERIEIFFSPDLVKNCSFTKPIRKYHLTALPSEYWKRYRFANRFVDMVRSRMPKFSIYTPRAKCTMMSNTPTADIELHLPVPLHVLSDLSEPATRIRLSRRNRTVEISRFELTPGRRGRAKVHFGLELNTHFGEWKKKVLSLPSTGRLAPLLQTESLQEDERQAILHLEECCRVCEKLEALVPSSVADNPSGDNEASNNPEKAPVSDTKPGPVQSLWESYATIHGVDEGPEANSCCVLREDTWRDVLRSIDSSSPRAAPAKPTPFAPQPLPSRGNEQNNTVWPSQQDYNDRPESVDAKSRNPSRHPAADALPLLSKALQNASEREIPSVFRAETPATSHLHGADKRFIPNLGWCIKRADGVDGFENDDVTYSVMFLDGTSLDVDAKKRFARFTDRHGKASARAPLTDHVPRRIQERLAVFDEFQHLFDGGAPRR